MVDKIQENRRLVLLVLVVVVMLCLLGVLAFNIFFRGGDGVVDNPTPTPTATLEVTEEPTPEPGQETPTPTRVIGEPTTEPEPTQEPTLEPEPTQEPTLEPPPGPTVIVTISPDFATPSPGESVIQIGDRLENGNFSEGFDESTGVGLKWESFKTGEAVIIFSPETAAPFIYEGDRAQRISVQNAYQTNQYAGLYQTMEVVAGETYTLNIHGQVRTFYGNVNDSGYGYRVQYAIVPGGDQNWQTITETAWIELPWGEEKLDTDQVKFSDFSDQITAESDQLTLFIRTWNKWADPKLVEYTLDSISLVGPEPGSVMMVETKTGEEMIDQPLPVTGTADGPGFLTDGRFWGAVVVLLLLAVGATYRAGWRW